MARSRTPDVRDRILDVVPVSREPREPRFAAIIRAQLAADQPLRIEVEIGLGNVVADTERPNQLVHRRRSEALVERAAER